MTTDFATLERPAEKRLWLLIALMAIALYSPFLDNPLIFDDRLYFRPEIAEFPTELSARWIHRLTLWFDSACLDLNVAPARLINVLVHIVNAVLLFQISVAWGNVARRAPARDPSVCLAAGFAAILFSVHPAAVYAVGYLTQRSILLATMFGLLALLLHTLAQTRRAPLYFVGSALCVFASVFSKEHSVMLPAFLTTLSWWLHRNGYRWNVRWTPVLLVYFSASLLIIHYVAVTPATFYEPHTANLAITPDRPYLSSILAQALLFFRYVGLWLIPNPWAMSIDLHSDLPYLTISWIGIGSILSAGIFITAVIALILRRGLLSLAGLLAAYAATMFATEFWAIRVSEAFVIYRSYLWMVFVPLLVSFALVSVGARWQMTKRGLIMLFVPIACATFLAAWDRLESMSSGRSVWLEAAEKNESVKNPAVARAYMNVGVYTGDLDERRRYYELAIAANPKFGPAYVNLGYHYIWRDQLNRALDAFRRGMDNDPQNVNARLGLGEVLQLTGRAEEAILEYQEVLRIQPGELRAKTDMAAARLRLGQPEAAISLLNEVISSPRPSDVVYFNLGVALEKTGKLELARRTVAEGLIKNPDTPLLLAYAKYLDEQVNPASRTKRSWLPRVTRPPTGLS